MSQNLKFIVIPVNRVLTAVKFFIKTYRTFKCLNGLLMILIRHVITSKCTISPC